MALTALQAVEKMRGYVAVYLKVLATKGSLTAHQAESLETDLKTLDHNLADLAAELASTAAPAGVAKGAAGRVLTYDEETPIFLDAEDAILKDLGRPFGRDGAERGALPLTRHIEMCKELGLPLHQAEFEALLVPGVAQ